jgi:hypothetical protein
MTPETAKSVEFGKVPMGGVFFSWRMGRGYVRFSKTGVHTGSVVSSRGTEYCTFENDEMVKA